MNPDKCYLCDTDAYTSPLKPKNSEHYSRVPFCEDCYRWYGAAKVQRDAEVTQPSILLKHVAQPGEAFEIEDIYKSLRGMHKP